VADRDVNVAYDQMVMMMMMIMMMMLMMVMVMPLLLLVMLTIVSTGTALEVGQGWCRQRWWGCSLGNPVGEDGDQR
jgi:biopolymer transport protein ExbB/TolQ